MGEVGYTNLRLVFKPRGDDRLEYDVTAAIDGQEPKTSTFKVPMSDDALQDAIRNLSETRSAATGSTTRKITPVNEHTVTAEQFGETLATALITPDIGRMFDDARRGGAAVRIRLELTDATYLLGIPWEFLRRNGKDLASQTDSTIVRELRSGEPARPFDVDGKIRMLGVIANPDRDLDTDGEKERVETALERCDVKPEWIEGPGTYHQLQRKLQEPFHILHFVGHSAFTADGKSIVLLEDENGGRDEKAADTIAQLIGRRNSLQLVVFNSCDGARTRIDDPFTGIATQLVEQGKSAVIAMQFEITDRAAKAFAEEFYYCLLHPDRRYAVDAAVAEARIAMLGVSPIEFATPVLFLRPGVVRLFNFDARQAPPEPAFAPPPSPVPAIQPLVAPVGTPDTAASRSDRPPKRRRWLVAAGGGAVVTFAALAGIGALISDDDPGDPADILTASEPAVPPGAGENAAADVPTTISRDVYLILVDCIEGDLFARSESFDAATPELSDAAFSQCDEARKQLEADGLDTGRVYEALVTRPSEAQELSVLVANEAATPADHQAFVASGVSLFRELRPLVRSLRGLDPSGGFFVDEMGGGEDVATADLPAAAYETINDETGVLSVDVPVAWGDRDVAPFTFPDGTQAPVIMASPSIDQFNESYATPGLFFTALGPVVSLDETLAGFAPAPDECTDAGLEDYEDGVYTGRFQTFVDCGGVSGEYITVAAVPEDGSFTAVVAMQIVSDADLAALDQVIASFIVTP